LTFVVVGTFATGKSKIDYGNHQEIIALLQAIPALRSLVIQPNTFASTEQFRDAHPEQG
jgi:hypothetical protein